MTTLGRRMNRRQDRCNLLGLCLTLGSRNGNHNQNRSKLLGLLLAGFSPRPSNLGCSLGTGSKQDRHTLLSPLMSRNSLCKRIAGAETEPAGPPPGRKAGPAAGHQEGKVPEPAGPPPGREAGRAAAGHQEGRVPEPAGPPPAKQPGKREPQALPLQPPAKKTASASTPAAEFRQTLQEYAKNVEVPKVIPKIPPDRLVARNLVGKASFRHFRASAERPRPWPKRVRASTHTSSERAVQVRLILLLCHSWVTFYIFWVLKPNQE